MKITVAVTGVEEVLLELDRRLEARNQAVLDEFEWFGKTTTEQMKADHPFQNITGWLEASIGYTVFPWSGNKTYLDLYAAASYATEVEFGHPGPPPARPYPFFWPVFYEWEPTLQDRLHNSVERTMEGG